jgi:hypothetical protein
VGGIRSGVARQQSRRRLSALGAQITSRYVRERGLVEAGVGNSLPKRAKRNFSRPRKDGSR